MRSAIPFSDFITSSAVNSPFAVVIGHPVKHSLSPLIHNHALRSMHCEVTYFPVEVYPNEYPSLETLFRHPNFRGANVTIPYKREVIKLLDSYSSIVQSIGACNTVVPQNEQLFGENTDVDGFMLPLQKYSELLKGADALVFGSGGASEAIIYGLKRAGIRKVFVVSRSTKAAGSHQHNNTLQYIDYEQWPDVSSDVKLFVNTTPLGMYPETDSSVIKGGQEELLRGKICYDIVYRPRQTLFLQQAASQDAICIDGTEMFLGQAAYAFELFFGHKFPLQSIRPILNDALAK